MSGQAATLDDAAAADRPCDRRSRERARRRAQRALWEERTQRALLAILRLAADAYGARTADVVGRARPQHISRARTLYCVLARRLVENIDGGPVPLAVIAGPLTRDHTTVMHHVGLGEHMLTGTGTNGGADRFRELAADVVASLRTQGIGVDPTADTEGSPGSVSQDSAERPPRLGH